MRVNASKVPRASIFSMLRHYWPHPDSDGSWLLRRIPASDQPSPVAPVHSLRNGNMTGEEDSAAHILVECSAFDLERAVLVRQIGIFVPGDFVSKRLESPPSWGATGGLAEAVMSRKEEAERAREQEEGRTWASSVVVRKRSYTVSR